MNFLEGIVGGIVLATALILYHYKNFKYLLDCHRKSRKKRFEEQEIPCCDFWTLVGGYEKFKEKLGGKTHVDWCVYHTHEDILRKGVRDIGCRLH